MVTSGNQVPQSVFPPADSAPARPDPTRPCALMPSGSYQFTREEREALSARPANSLSLFVSFLKVYHECPGGGKGTSASIIPEMYRSAPQLRRGSHACLRQPAFTPPARLQPTATQGSRLQQQPEMQLRFYGHVKNWEEEEEEEEERLPVRSV